MQMQFLLEKWNFLSLNGFVVLWIFETYFFEPQISNGLDCNSNRNKKGFVAFLIGNSVNMKLKSFFVRKGCVTQ